MCSTNDKIRKFINIRVHLGDSHTVDRVIFKRILRDILCHKLDLTGSGERGMANL
jgi:hypothetical protein